MLFFFSCSKNQAKESNLAFYHWKTDTNLSVKEKEVLKKLGVNKIYLRFFDVKVNKSKQVYPEAVLRKIDTGFKSFQVIPTIYITNESLLKIDQVDSLSAKIEKLVSQMFDYHFKEKPSEIQIDCDWTESTKEKYFELLSKLERNMKVSATIRLHQIKYANKTGVPPCQYGSLMLYNMGNIKDSNENSIFSYKIMKNYLSQNTTYPLPLSLALPIYRWGIVKLPTNQYKIVNNLNIKHLEENDKVTRLAKNWYKTDSAIFLSQKYLPENTKIKLEEVSIFELQKSVDYLKDVNGIDWIETIFYHLDEDNFEMYQLDDLKKCNINS